jgi:hypothetical protein
MCEMLGIMMRKGGFEVVTAETRSDAAEALQALRS